jgi:hypothetical protein
MVTIKQAGLTVPLWDRLILWLWSAGVGLDRQQDGELVRQARDAETAHLDAVLKTHGAAYLRLARLSDTLQGKLEGKPELRALPGEAPALWLDVSHAVTMEPDAKTFRITRHGVTDMQVLLETTEQSGVTDMAQKLLAHAQVRAARLSTLQQHGWSFATLFYVWLTGIVTGAAGLALYLIYLRKIQF